MRCQRCQGFMTVNAYVDRGSRRSPLWLRAWRCVNCGEVYEPEMFLNPAVHRNWLHRTVMRLAGKRFRRDELMALTS
jgi:hypothetical protein